MYFFNLNILLLSKQNNILLYQHYLYSSLQNFIKHISAIIKILMKSRFHKSYSINRLIMLVVAQPSLTHLWFSSASVSNIPASLKYSSSSLVCSKSDALGFARLIADVIPKVLLASILPEDTKQNFRTQYAILNVIVVTIYANAQNLNFPSVNDQVNIFYASWKSL